MFFKKEKQQEEKNIENKVMIENMAREIVDARDSKIQEKLDKKKEIKNFLAPYFEEQHRQQKREQCRILNEREEQVKIKLLGKK